MGLGFAPAVVRATELVEAGVIGKIQTAHVRLSSKWGPTSNRDMCTINHLVAWWGDVLNRVVGVLPKRILLLNGHGTPGRGQNHSTLHFDYDGVWGAFQCNITALGVEDPEVEVSGDDGDLIASIFAGEVGWRIRNNPKWLI